MNYINLSTALAIRRAKEVGVRRSLGAVKKQLIGQFMIESALINVTAAMLSIAYFMLPVLNNIIGKELELIVLQRQGFWLWFSLAIFSGPYFPDYIRHLFYRDPLWPL
ncbi:MAG: FtsX-like permease family protein [Anditalea sp.]